MTDKTYYEKTLDSLAVNCETRGIPEPEYGSVKAAITEKYGVALEEMNEPQLRRLNRGLGDILFIYLEGIKRRPSVVAQVDAGPSAAEGEITAEGV